MRTLTLAAAAALLAISVTSAKAETFPVIDNPTVMKECTDCHMAFPPQTLPKALWEKIIGDLSNHYGDDATLDAATTAEILDYHVKNASDVTNVRASIKWRSNKMFTRITDAPRFVDKHRQCPPEVWSHAKVGSKANCLACHTTMDTNGSTDVNLRFLPANLQAACGEDD